MNIVYEKTPIKGCKRICQSIGGSRCEKLKKFLFTLSTLLWSIQDMVGISQKCSEMCVWIVRFGQKLKKWDRF
jgi:hypothetical protein